MGGGRHIAPDREVGDEGRDVRGAELRRVALAAEKDVLAHPPKVSFLRSYAVMARAHGLAHLLEQFGHDGALLIVMWAYNLAGLWPQNTPTED